MSSIGSCSAFPVVGALKRCAAPHRAHTGGVLQAKNVFHGLERALVGVAFLFLFASLMTTELLTAFWSRYSYETSITLAAFAGFWILHLLIRYVIGPQFKWYRSLPLCGDPDKKSKIQFEATVVSIASVVLYQDPPMHPLWGSNHLSTIQFGISTGYFLWDLSLFTVYWSEFGIGMFFHAIITSSCFGMGMIPFIQRALTFFLLYELSTLFMDVILVMRLIGKTSGAFYLINGLLFAVAFFIVRILLGTRMTVEFWQMFIFDMILVPSMPFGWKFVAAHYTICSGGLAILNFIWFAAIIKEMKNALIPPKNKPE